MWLIEGPLRHSLTLQISDLARINRTRHSPSERRACYLHTFTPSYLHTFTLSHPYAFQLFFRPLRVLK